MVDVFAYEKFIAKYFSKLQLFLLVNILYYE